MTVEMGLTIRHFISKLTWVKALDCSTVYGKVSQYRTKLVMQHLKIWKNYTYFMKGTMVMKNCLR